MNRKKKLQNLTNDKTWKEKNKNYIKELQRFFDKVDNIEDEYLRNSILGQMLRCDEELTKIAEDMFLEYYKLGVKQAKKEYFSDNGTN